MLVKLGSGLLRKLVLATHNPHKVTEMQALLADLSVTVVPATVFPGIPDIEEDGETFQANAAKKAVAIANFTGEWTVADDSGLEVDFLQGKPGVYSARFAGDDATDAENNAKLLGLLKDVPWEKRQARFRSVLAIVRPGGEPLFATGSCEGYIDFEARGFAGFGYDPLFYVPDIGKTFAEMAPEEKNRISHRAKAIEKAKEILVQLLRE